MGRIHILLIMCSLAVFCLAQTQQGFVKTIGRPNKPGIALGGVSVRLKGGHNAVLSKDDGTFSMMMSGKKVGDAYSLQQVQKTGYELNEMDVIGRQYAFSDKVPLTIVMVSTSQLQADKQRIEDNAYKVAEKNYHAKRAQLGKDKDAGTITIEQYRIQIQELQDKFEKYQSIIDDLANHYAHTDYDGLNEKEREINICTENGDLERADSLIHTIFNPIDVVKRNKEALIKIDQNLLQANDIINQANSDMASILKQQKKDAEYLFQLYTIALSRYDNDKALFYIETRAKLDSTNAKWQINAARFLDDYLANYPKALYYYQQAINQLCIKEESILEASTYSNVGVTYYNMGNYQTALDYEEKALNMYGNIVGESHHLVATVYNNIGIIYSRIGDYRKTIHFYEKALAIDNMFPDKYLSEKADLLNNLGIAYSGLGDNKKALELCEKALSIQKKLSGKTAVDMALTYNNIGYIHSWLGNPIKALEFYEQSLNLKQRILSPNHPSVAISLNNIGYIYSSQGNYSEALKCYEKAIVIQRTILGEKHSDVAASYTNLGDAYNRGKRYDMALDYYVKALDIWKGAFGTDHPNVAISYNNIGDIYLRLGDYQRALYYFSSALQIREKTSGTDHPNTATSYNNVGGVYFYMENFSKAIEYFEKALVFQERTTDKDSPELATSYDNIGELYELLENYPKALKYYEKALSVLEKAFGGNRTETSIEREKIKIVKQMMEIP